MEDIQIKGERRGPDFIPSPSLKLYFFRKGIGGVDGPVDNGNSSLSAILSTFFGDQRARQKIVENFMELSVKPAENLDLVGFLIMGKTPT